jgi:hypothetical protein
MIWNRFVVTAACLSIPVLGVLPATSTAAQPPAVVTTATHRYFVEYRAGRSTAWQVAGPFHSHKHASKVAHHMKMQGLHAHVVAR